MKENYDIFISYRREGGAQYARILQLMLQQRGYKVFLDYDELTDGIFSDHIKTAIKETPIFMLVLSRKSMYRCINEDDWVRQEIMLAIEQKKHIVPINPDKEFDGFPEGMPLALKETIGTHQHSDINFGQALGVTVDLLIKNRLVPTLGERNSEVYKDENFDSAKKTLRRANPQRLYKKIINGVIMFIIFLGACFYYLNIQSTEKLRTDLHEKYNELDLYLSPNLTKLQLNTIDDILSNMVMVKDGILWMSKYEFTIGQWYGISDKTCDDEIRYLPITNVNYGEIYKKLLDLGNMTNLMIELPSVEEWKYAAHGGIHNDKTKYSGSDNPNEVAWYEGNSDGIVHPCNGRQGKLPNKLDLFDMSGNVSELCNSSYEKSDNAQFIICGGNYTTSVEELVIDLHKPFDSNGKDKSVGFRIVLRK